MGRIESSSLLSWVGQASSKASVGQKSEAGIQFWLGPRVRSHCGQIWTGELHSAPCLTDWHLHWTARGSSLTPGRWGGKENHTQTSTFTHNGITLSGLLSSQSNSKSFCKLLSPWSPQINLRAAWRAVNGHRVPVSSQLSATSMALDGCLRPSGSLVKCELVAGPGDAKVNGAVQVFSRCIPLAQGPSHPIYIPYAVSSQKVIPGWSRGWDGEALDSSFHPFLP